MSETVSEIFIVMSASSATAAVTPAAAETAPIKSAKLACTPLVNVMELAVLASRVTKALGLM